VDRIIRAHKEKTPWKCCVVIPLLPGYTYPIDSGEGSSVRLIMECQNRTISRGSASIFSRLRKEGIDVSPRRLAEQALCHGELELMNSPRST
jgi:phospholipase D1/2